MKMCTDKEKELIELIKSSPDRIADGDYLKMNELTNYIRLGKNDTRLGNDAESGD